MYLLLLKVFCFGFNKFLTPLSCCNDINTLNDSEIHILSFEDEQHLLLLSGITLYT